MSWDYGPLIEAVQERMDCMVGAAPPCGGLSLIPGSSQLRRDLSGGVYLVMRLSVLCKAERQNEGLAMLAAAQRSAAGMKCRAGDWRITGCSPVGAPVREGQDTQGWYLFSAVMEVTAFCPEV